MIVFAGLVAHNPLLLKDKKFEQSQSAMGFALLRKALAASNAEVILIVSEHARMFEKKYAVFNSPTLTPQLKSFGVVHSGDASYPTDVSFLSALHREQIAEHLSLQHVAEHELDYGSALALRLLGVSSTERIIVVGTTTNSIIDHAEIGTHLKEVFHSSPRRVAVLITGDASHRHTSDSPAGFSEHALKFETALIDAIEHRSVAALTKLVHEFSDAEECVSKALGVGFGLLRRFPANVRILSHEVRYGVGLINAILFSE